jgi:hypothetical protein
MNETFSGFSGIIYLTYYNEVIAGKIQPFPALAARASVRPQDSPEVSFILTFQCIPSFLNRERKIVIFA